MNLQRFSLFILSLSFFAACSSSALEEVEQTTAYGYIEKFSRNKDDFAKQGRYERLTEKGQLVEEAFFTNDTLNGIRILYSEKGDTQVVESYKMGVFDGPFRSFNEDGSLSQVGNYVNNEMKGSWEKYYANGQLMEVVQFENNNENGPFIEYYENGNLKAEGAYLGGDNEHGELKLYDESGQLIRKMNCENGICRTFWKAEGVE